MWLPSAMRIRDFKESFAVKKTFLAALASLMLAGAISAASGLTTDRIGAGSIAMAGDGTSPVFLSTAPSDTAGVQLAPNK